MKSIAILTGGPSAERDIALKSAQLLQQYLDPSRYTHRTILVEKNGWFEQGSGYRVDLNDFSLRANGDRVTFDFVFLMIHGTPVEDGKLQGYFEHLGIPHSTCDTLTCALTFNKQWCKDFLKVHGVPMARSWLIKSSQRSDFRPEGVQFPVFVKPNNNGSSYGISRVVDSNDLPEALDLAAEFDTEIMIEEEINGREFSCGVVRDGSETHVFPLTEIIPDAEFFDYAAKYEGAGQEITPADLSKALTVKCQEQSARLYDVLRCKGMVRFDYILEEETFKLLEVNTVPGLSETSIIPQMAIAYGWSVTKLFDVVIRDCMAE